MATIFLVRHGAHALLDRVLVGCKVDIPLDSIGRQQARALAERFSRESVDIVQSSPRARARQTAGPIAERVGVTLEVAPAVDEIDCGEWSGRSFDELASERAWQEWNVRRSVSRAPGGESMTEVQRRAVIERRGGHTCNPHSVLALPAQRPPRRSSPGATGRVQGQQPIDG